MMDTPVKIVFLRRKDRCAGVTRRTRTIPAIN